MSIPHTMRTHWPEYLIEAAALGVFMFSATFFSVRLELPGFALHDAIANGDVRRALIGVAMGMTAIVLIYSPWGQRSGAHMNPAVTLTFLALGKVARVDAAFYVLAHFIGGSAGVVLGWAVFGAALADPPVRFALTVPGADGAGVAFVAEFVISAGLMLTVLTFSNRERLAPYTGLAAGLMVALYITFEAPLSGMSMNPARSFASAVAAREWAHFWIYITAPVLGMAAAARLYRAICGSDAAHCAKLQHPLDQRCIHCGYEPPAQARHFMGDKSHGI